MKRLYNCSAWYDKSTLLSYNTKIIEFNDNGTAELHVYRSITTYQHIRKYANRLFEIGEPKKGQAVRVLYRLMLENRKAHDIVLNLSNYSFEVIRL